MNRKLKKLAMLLLKLKNIFSYIIELELAQIKQIIFALINYQNLSQKSAMNFITATFILK
jgi:hypothetical protein